MKSLFPGDYPPNRQYRYIPRSRESPSEFVSRRQFDWGSEPCPFCGKPCETTWLRILSTYSLSCNHCGEVVEGFELYQDQHGYTYTENQVFPKPAPRGESS